MRVVNEPVVARFTQKHADSRQWLENWLTVARSARWQTIQDVKQAYPAADGGVKVASGARVSVFDVGGNKYRLVTDIAYAIQTVIILELMTHAEYSRDLWKRRY
jgi:mRNA interferase HigB